MWNHTRGCLPLVATAQRFEDVTGGVEILWRKRRSRTGDAPLEKLSEDFDLLVITALGHASRGMLAPLENLLPPKCLSEMAAASVGRSYGSYWFEGHLWAPPIDAAAPLSSWRPDLIGAVGYCLTRNI